jgi:hypothetical protein
MSAGDEYYEDLLKITTSYQGERNPAQNVMYASCLGAHGASGSALNSLAEQIGALFAEYCVAYMASAISYVLTQVADWTSADGLTGEHVETVSGGYDGETLTAQTCSLINLDSLTRYRGGRGRVYLPQPTTAQVSTDQTWTSTHIDNLTNGFQSFINGLNALTIGDDLLTYVLYHRSGNKVVEQGFEDVVAVALSPIPGTQRRRVRRVGHIA